MEKKLNGQLPSHYKFISTNNLVSSDFIQIFTEKSTNIVINKKKFFKKTIEIQLPDHHECQQVRFQSELR